MLPVILLLATAAAAPAASITFDGAARPLRPQVARRIVEYDVATGATRAVRVPRSGRRTVSNSPAIAGIAPAAPQPAPRVIWGADERTPVPSPSAFPWSAQTKVLTTFPSGAVFECSGTLIAAQAAVTAGHCVHDARQGGWAQRVEVVPGLDHGVRPFGIAVATHFLAELGWTRGERPEHDLAVVRLDHPIGDRTGFLEIAAVADADLGGATVHLAGYPLDLCDGWCQYAATSPVAGSRRTVIYYGADTSPGSSGSGVYVDTGGVPRVVAVHRGTCTERLDRNCGVRFNRRRAAIVTGWLAR